MHATARKGMHPTQGPVPVRVAAMLRAGSPAPTAVLEAGGEQPSGYYPVDVFAELLQGDPRFERAVVVTFHTPAPKATMRGSDPIWTPSEPVKGRSAPSA